MTKIARYIAAFWLTLSALALSACGKADEDVERARVERDMKAWLGQQLGEFKSAAGEMQRAAPAPSGRGWSAEQDAQAIEQTKAAWLRARVAYELIEGAVAPLFPESDTATDARYDDFLTVLGSVGDAQPFDDQGVVGMHAIERVLWADRVPKETIEFENGIPGYRAAAFPATEAEARDMKEKLMGKLLSDIAQLQTQLSPVQLDIAFAFRGLIDLTNEQLEKVDRAATGREESRYAQTTMRDLRANRDGCVAAYRIFQPWLLSRGKAELDAQVQAGFQRLKRSYDAVPGDAIPRPPVLWSSLEPRKEHLETPFGKLFDAVRRETDDAHAGSLSNSLMSVADALGLPKAVLR